jgi:hypothetical protein
VITDPHGAAVVADIGEHVARVRDGPYLRHVPRVPPNATGVEVSERPVIVSPVPRSIGA